MKVGVVTFPGSNCDYDCYHAAEDAMGAEAVYLWHTAHDLQGVDAVLLPGGFSFGDYLRAGAIAATSPIMREVAAFARSGGPVLGVCNGFQILCEAGLLPGALVRNRGLKFVHRSAYLRVERAAAPFTDRYRQGDVLEVPVAHGEGCYVADEATLDRLEGEGRVAFRYVTQTGDPAGDASPSGSTHGIAGIVNAAGNVLGMMPHPERAVDPVLGSTAGVPLFRSLALHLGAA